MPDKAMHQFITRKGCWFSWGWLPPLLARVATFMGCAPEGDAKIDAPPPAIRLLVESLAKLAPAAACNGWVCVGTSEVRRVWLGSPPTCPQTMPLLTRTGVR